VLLPSTRGFLYPGMRRLHVAHVFDVSGSAITRSHSRRTPQRPAPIATHSTPFSTLESTYTPHNTRPQSHVPPLQRHYYLSKHYEMERSLTSLPIVPNDEHLIRSPITIMEGFC